ncbi:MAG: hypothetical protein GY851_01910 [bacterium]|nr:hypothetical protein [bacterium]
MRNAILPKFSVTFFTFAAILLALLLCAPAQAESQRLSIGEGADEIPLLIVEGTPYEMGKAFGSLMKTEIQTLFNRVRVGLELVGEERHTPESLDAAWAQLEPHTDERFKEEMRGLADGAELPLEDVVRLHTFPAVSDYACSAAAMWGEATKDDHLYQIRNLDWIMEGGFQDYPVVVVYVPDEGVPHVNVTFAGFIGCNTGMNAEGITLSEIGDSPGREYPFDLNGTHFTTMFRTILYDATNLGEAVDMIKNAKRIKKYHFVVGDGAPKGDREKGAVKMKAHAPDLIIWTDNDENDDDAPNVMNDLVYHAEGRDPLAWEHIQANYGSYDSQSMIGFSKAVPTHGGNLLDVVYDATGQELWVAYAEKMDEAYKRPFVHLDLKEHFRKTSASHTILLLLVPAVLIVALVVFIRTR